MNTNTITPEVETLTPEQFAARVYATYGKPAETPADYFVRNLDTDKLELHITKPMYSAYDRETKEALWEFFRWSRNRGCWVERTFTGYTDPEALLLFAKSIGLTDNGYFVTLHVDDTGAVTREEPATAAPVEKPKAKAPVKPVTPAASKAERHETISTERKYFTGPIGTDEIENALQRGSLISEGKVRIAAFFANNHTPDECKKFLKEEYGMSGWSHTFLNGAGGFVDCRGDGMTISGGYFGKGTELKLSWVSVASYLHTMVQEGRYLTGKDAERYNAVAKHFHGKIPDPTPRFGWASLKDA